ncbi:unnamed protein product [marine sediment metagenome]|uniref:Uncharacterized protein n=1 Tax=marine sediment metagenome TaxID=412755 RepID=X1KFV2_9ZZZZ
MNVLNGVKITDNMETESGCPGLPNLIYHDIYEVAPQGCVKAPVIGLQDIQQSEIPLKPEAISLTKRRLTRAGSYHRQGETRQGADF